MKKYFLNTLRTRIILLTGLFSFILISSIIFFYVKIYINNNNEKVIEKLIIESEKKAILIQSFLEKYINATGTLASSFEEFEQIPLEKRRTTFHSFLYNNIKQNDEIYAIWTKFKPYTLDNLDSIYKNKLLGTNGQFIKCFYRYKSEIIEKEITVADEIEFETKKYINIFHDNIKSNIKAPVLNIYTPTFIDSSYLITVSSAIYSNSKFIGIIGVDVNVSNITKLSKEKLIDEDYYILDENQNIVYNKNQKFIGKNFKSIYTNLYSKYNIEYNLSEGNTININEKMLNSNNYSLILFVPLNIKSTKQNWALVKVVSNNELDINNKKIWFDTFIIILIFLILSLTIIIILSNIFKEILDIFTKLLENIIKGIFDYKDKRLDKYTTFELKNISLLINKLSASLASLEKYANQIKDGKLDSEYTLLSNNDNIGKSLIEMKTNLIENRALLQKRESEDAIIKWISDALADFGIILRKNIGNFDNLTFEVISNLVKYLNAIQGAIFIYDDDDKNDIHLSLASLFAYDRRRYETKKIKNGDGLIGTCALEKKLILLNKIPEDYVEFSSGLGTAKPKSAIIVPLVYNEQIYGVFEIAKLYNFEEHEIEFVNKVSESIASSFASEKISSQTNKMLEKANFRYDQMIKYENNLSIKFDKLQETHTKLIKIDAEKNNVINALNEIVLNVEFDNSFKVIKINSNFLRYLKQNYEEALAKNYYELFDIELNVFEEHSRRLTNLRNGYKQEFNLKLLILEQEHWLKCIFNPIYDADRKISRFLLLAFDNTQFVLKDSKISELTEQVQFQIEQNNIQEIEITNMFAEITEEKNEVAKQITDKENLIKEIENQEKRIEFYKQELEKRVNRFKKIEQNLKEKNKKLEDELNHLKK